MFKNLLIIILLSIIKFTSLVGENGQPVFEFTTDRSSVRIPIKVSHNILIMPLRINNGPELNFILDSGVNETILTEPLLARALQLEGEELVNILGLGTDGIVQAERIENVEISLSGITGKNQSVLLIQDDVLSLSEVFGFPVHGIIGHDLLKEFPIKINYKNNFIRIYRDSDYRIRRNSNIIPIEIINNKPYIEATIKAKSDTSVTLPLLLDLGASHTLYLNNQYTFLSSDSTITSYLGKGISGDLIGEEGRINELKLGDQITLNNPIIAFADPEEMWLERLNIDWDGLIGGSILKRFHIIIDYESQHIVLRKNSRFRRSFNSNLSGINLIAKGSSFDEYIITFVRPGSAADDAGVKKGDQIIRINNKDTDNMNLQDIIDILNKPINTRITLAVSRDYIIEDESNEDDPETKSKKHRLRFNLREDLPHY